MEEKEIRCPYCNGLMKKGIFHVTGANKLLWVPENVKIPAITFHTKKLTEKGAVILDFKRVSSNAYISAHCCETCQAVIFRAKN